MHFPNVRLSFARFALIAISLVSIANVLSAATLNPIQRSRVFTTAGAIAGSLSTCSTATPVVCTATAAHRLIDGDPIQVTGVTTNAAAIGNFYAKVTTFSTTTFGLYSDAGLTTAVAGVGSGTGGAFSFAFPISAITADWTLHLNVDSLTTGNKRVLLSIQESADGFVTDIRTLQVMSVQGFVSFNGGSITNGVRSYQLSSARFGVASACIRVLVQAIDSSTSATVSAFVEY